MSNQYQIGMSDYRRLQVQIDRCFSLDPGEFNALENSKAALVAEDLLVAEDSTNNFEKVKVSFSAVQNSVGRMSKKFAFFVS